MLPIKRKTLKIIGIISLVIIVIIAAFFIYAVYRLNHIKDIKNLEQSIDKHAAAFLAKGSAYGMVIGVYKNGKIYLKGYGTTLKGQDIAPDSATVFELASTSKLFTTATLQIMADSGELKLEDKIQDFVQDKIKLPASAANTTLLHLATHQSGFPSLPESFIAKMKDETNPYKSLVKKDIYDYLQNCAGKRPEGTFEYSNFGMGLLGHLLEVKAGMPYEELVQRRLLKELDMHSTFVTVDSIHKDEIAQGYDENGNATPVWTDNVLTGAGSFLSNGADMIRFLKANLDENGSRISKSLTKTQHQQLNGSTGLGWILPDEADRLIGNKSMVWHNGMAGGYTSFIAVDKANNFGLFVLSNKAEDITAFGMKMSMIIRSQSWKE